jgi:hypothetical protein
MSKITHPQFIIICNGDSDTATKRVLATRRVFTSLEDAQAFASKERGSNRELEVVECYFAVPDSLYRQDWVPSLEIDDKEAR